MARRWTPQRFVMMRRIRVAVCVVAMVVASTATFALTTRKSVALDINGETTTVTTYAMTVDRLLKDQGVNVKSHDLVTTTSGNDLRNHDVVTVRSAYQTTITIDGQQVPFWTVATSVDQLLDFFEANEHEAARITVDIENVYNQLTGGLVINTDGPVTVIADGNSSVAPNGKLPAASILDSKGITLNKEDRVSVEKNGDETILRVRRVTHGEQTRTTTVPFSTQTVIDPTLAPGQTVVRQTGVNGTVEQVFDVTYVDGVAESETLVSETTTAIAIDQIIAVGPAVTQPSNGDSQNAGSNDGTTQQQPTTQPEQSTGTPSTNSGTNTDQPSTDTDSGQDTGSSDTVQQPNNPPATDNTGGTSNNGDTGTSNGNTGSTGTNENTDNSSDSGASQGRLWHPTVAQAQAYAAGAAAQYGWTGAEWDALIWLWDHESGWLWYADNPWSDAYGIPQALPGSKMGPGWQDDGAVQIDWGLSYIAQRYGSPTQAVTFWKQNNWY